jgi:hypothetical protein
MPSAIVFLLCVCPGGILGVERKTIVTAKVHQNLISMVKLLHPLVAFRAVAVFIRVMPVSELPVSVLYLRHSGRLTEPEEFP